MKSQLFQGSIVVKKSPIEGHGVFANQHFKPDELIEECKVLLTLYKDSYQNYVFNANELGDGISAMPLGYGAIYNHAEHPNAKFYFDAKQELLIFTAVKAITKGEEILVNYGENWFSNRGLSVKYPFGYRLRRIFKKKVCRFLLVSAFLGCLIAFIK